MKFPKLLCYIVLVAFPVVFPLYSTDLGFRTRRSGILENGKTLLIGGAHSNGSFAYVNLNCYKSCAGNTIKLSVFLRRCHCANQLEYLSKTSTDLFRKPFLCSLREECQHPIEYSLLTDISLTCPPASSKISGDYLEELLAFNLNQDHFKVSTVTQTGNQTSYIVHPQSFDFEHTEDRSRIVARAWDDGFYAFGMSMSNCESVKFSLSIHQPKSYLALDQVNYEKFSKYMTVVYAVFCLIWVCVCYRNRQNLVRFQFFLTFLIVICLLEHAIFYSIYSMVDQTGNLPNGLLTLIVLITAIRRSFSRLLLILVSYGYGILRPRMKPIYRRSVLFTLAYFTATLLETIYSTETPFISFGLTAILLIQVILDVITCVWVLTNLNMTFQNLKLKRNRIRLNLYMKFTVILVVLSIVAFLLWTYLMVTEHFSACMKIIDLNYIAYSIWWFITTILLLTVTILWRPGETSKEFAYISLVDDDRHQTITLSQEHDDRQHGGDNIMMSAVHDATNASATNEMSADANNRAMDGARAGDTLRANLLFEQKADKLIGLLEKDI